MLEHVFTTMLRVQQAFNNKLRSFHEDDSGMGTIEMVLIIVVLIALVIIFRGKIQKLLNTIFGQIESGAGEAYSSMPTLNS